VVVSGTELVEDVRKAPDNVLSVAEPMADVRIRITSKVALSCSRGSSQFIEIDYTLDLLNKHNVYHTDVIRSKLTRNIAVTFKDVREELINALEDSIPTDEDSKW
jgi:hypothetical protein